MEPKRLHATPGQTFLKLALFNFEGTEMYARQHLENWIEEKRKARQQREFMRRDPINSKANCGKLKEKG